jgi:two-component system response regulator RstA
MTVNVEGRGDRAARRILAEQPDLVILDLTLPGQDGLAVCGEVRARFPGPILILTARGDDDDQIAGLELGADDYVAKPVKPVVLLARLRALLRRGPPSAAEEPRRIEIDGLVMDQATRECFANGAKLELTSGEFDTLHLLASRAGEVLSRAFLHRRLFATEWSDVDRSVDLRVSRLRQKLHAVFTGEERIKTVRGTGYLYRRS